MEERQTNYTLMEGFELPSKGLIYDKKVNPHVELRGMTARDEMKRLSPSSTPLKTLADIIEGCMIEKPAVHVYDMCLGDYEYLLHKLRIVSYGQDYAVALNCPHCGEYNETLADLAALEVKEFDISEFEELRSIKLPKSGRQIVLKFKTPRDLDEQEIRVKELRRKFKNAEINFEIMVQLTSAIDLVDGNKLSQVDLETFINNLPAMDMQKILNSIDKLNTAIGLDTTIHLNCKHCGGDIRTYFRFGTEFFRPSNI